MLHRIRLHGARRGALMWNAHRARSELTEAEAVLERTAFELDPYKKRQAVFAAHDVLMNRLGQLTALHGFYVENSGAGDSPREMVVKLKGVGILVCLDTGTLDVTMRLKDGSTQRVPIVFDPVEKRLRGEEREAPPLAEPEKVMPFRSALVVLVECLCTRFLELSRAQPSHGVGGSRNYLRRTRR